jgi:spore coat polysaccharide biosynthesis protein SpsF
VIARDRLLCVVQARTGSTRLPGKVLMDVAGRPMLRFMLDRLAGLRVDELVVATSTLARDDAVVEIAAAAGLPVCRGDEGDVLSRFAGALDQHPSDHVIRLTADCPLSDPSVVEMVIARHLESGADYTSNVFPRTFPRGLDVEMVRAPALRVAATEAASPAEREHVTPFLYRRPRRFRLANVRYRESLGRERWTVDTEQDLVFVRDIVARMGDGAWAWREGLSAVGVRAIAPRGVVVLEPAGREHVSFFLSCRNDVDAIRHSRSGRPLDRREHAQWFAAVIDEPGVRLRVACVDGEAVGTVRVDVHDGVGEVGIAVAPPHRNRGFGTAMLDALVADVASDPQVVELVASVHVGNAASMRVFARSGFTAIAEDGDFRVLRRHIETPMETA